MNEQELLRSFDQKGDEQAFRQLVDRYTGLVYSGALRRVGAGHADDVVQGVFLVMARKSGSLASRRHLKLAAWLHVTTGFVARETLRAEARRHDRETHAQVEEAMNTHHRSDHQAAWDDVKPHIDAALDHLSETDREAVISRFFKGESFAEIGKRLHASPNTATKRVTRALERMRRVLVRRGVTVAAPALGVMLGAQRAEALGYGLEGVRALGVSAIAADLPQRIADVASLSLKAAAVAQTKAMVPVVAMAIGLFVGGGAVTRHVLQLTSVPFTVLDVAPVDLTLNGFARLPDDSIAYQINSRQGARTYFVKPGETVEGYLLSGPDADEVDVTDAVQLVGANDTLNLLRDTSSRTTRFMALIRGADGVEDWVRPGEQVQTPQGEYELISIAVGKSHILVKPVAGGDIKRIPVR